MKILYSLLFFICCSSAVAAQAGSKLDSIKAFIKTNAVSINKAKPMKGFEYYYGCDSNLFFKSVYGDTIQLYTVFAQWRMDLKDLEDKVKDESFGTTTIIRKIEDDGKILTFFYGKTLMVFRHDSLFLIENSTPIPEHFYSHFDDFFQGKINKDEFEKKDDSLAVVREKAAVYLPKLIFTKSMFKKSSDFQTDKRFNFDRDKIVLEKKWIENGKTCYLIKIKNKEKNGTETSYGYAFDDDMKFVWWEGCNR